MDSVSTTADQTRKYAEQLAVVASRCPDAEWVDLCGRRVIAEERIEPTDVEVFVDGERALLVPYAVIAGLRVYRLRRLPGSAQDVLYALGQAHPDVHRTIVEFATWGHEGRPRPSMDVPTGR